MIEGRSSRSSVLRESGCGGGSEVVTRMFTIVVAAMKKYDANEVTIMMMIT